MVWIICLSLTAAGALICLLIAVKRNRAVQDGCERKLRQYRGLAELLLASAQSPTDDGRLASRFCDFCRDHLRADGAVLYRSDPAATDAVRMIALAVSGSCAHWIGASGSGDMEGSDQPPGFELAEDPPYDFFWSRRPQHYKGNELNTWVPEEWARDYSGCLAVPVNTAGGNAVLILLRRPGGKPFDADDDEDLFYLTRLAEIAFSELHSRLRMAEVEGQMHRAHEDGMLQVSSGIIHNIGNAITVIQLALDTLGRDEFMRCPEAADLIADEILPDLRTAVADGTVAAFFNDSPRGPVVIDALEGLVEHIRKTHTGYVDQIDFIQEKFRTVIELITLQQSFIGELGTENVVPIRAILEDVRTSSQHVLDDRDIEFVTAFDLPNRVLADAAMLRHIFILLLKYAIDSIEASRKLSPQICLVASDREMDGRKWVVVELRDDGAGFEHDPFNPDSDDGTVLDERMRDMQFCRQRVAKYGGELTIESAYGSGTRYTMTLPDHD